MLVVSQIVYSERSLTLKTSLFMYMPGHIGKSTKVHDVARTSPEAVGHPQVPDEQLTDSTGV